MRFITGAPLLSGDVYYTYGFSSIMDRPENAESLMLQFYWKGHDVPREALPKLNRILARNEPRWLILNGKEWFLDTDVIKSKIPELFDGFDWIEGRLLVDPNVETERDNKGVESTYIRFFIQKDECIMQRNSHIFLSHKGVNKPHVREFFRTLEELGFKPWLDEDAMSAGMPLDRAIMEGMERSCAAVFFITPDYTDAGFLSDEINYAIMEKRTKGDKFALISLVLGDDTGRKGVVPKLLTPYVYKNPANDLEALREILRALPIRLGEPRWSA